MSRVERSAALLVLGLAACLAAGCGGGEAEAGSGAGTDDRAEGGRGDGGYEPPQTSPLGKAVAAIRPSLDGKTWRPHLEEVLEGWRGERQPMTDVLRATYERRGWRPVFLESLWPGEAAAVLVKAVREVPSHGLPSSPYRPKALIPLHAALALDPAEGAGTLTPEIAETERLADLEWQLPRTIYKQARKNEMVPEVRYRPFAKLPELGRLEPARRCLLHAVARLGEGGGRDAEAEAARCVGGAERLGSAVDGALAAIAEREDERERLALLDAMLLLAYYQWVLDFSIDLRVHPFKSLGAVNRTRLPRESQAALLDALSDLEDAEAFGRRLEGRLPEEPAYRKAREALARYVRLMDEGHVEELRPGRQLEKGAEGDAVAALQRRLAAEGFYDGPVSGTFDDATHEAVARFQRGHNLPDGGVVGDQTYEALNVPMEWRVKQILSTLGRLRESPLARARPGGTHVLVNLPAFELEVRAGDDSVIRRHRVIVGSNRPSPDPTNDGVVWHSRRTPLFDTKITEVVLNPTWIVPEAIRIDEIEPKALASPTYLEENHFTKVGDLLVQGPAESNPLGKVRLTLESTDSVYLHDTDKRELFREPVRDLSHGCIRTDEPVELAAFLLEKQGVDRARIDKRIAEGTTLPIELASPVPISIEYRTVGFADDGSIIFYADIYGYDVAYWKRRTPITRRFP